MIDSTVLSTFWLGSGTRNAPETDFACKMPPLCTRRVRATPEVRIPPSVSHKLVNNHKSLVRTCFVRWQILIVSFLFSDCTPVLRLTCRDRYQIRKCTGDPPTYEMEMWHCVLARDVLNTLYSVLSMLVFIPVIPFIKLRLCLNVFGWTEFWLCLRGPAATYDPPQLSAAPRVLGCRD